MLANNAENNDNTPAMPLSYGEKRQVNSVKNQNKKLARKAEDKDEKARIRSLGLCSYEGKEDPLLEAKRRGGFKGAAHGIKGKEFGAMGAGFGDLGGVHGDQGRDFGVQGAWDGAYTPQEVQDRGRQTTNQRRLKSTTRSLDGLLSPHSPRTAGRALVAWTTTV